MKQVFHVKKEIKTVISDIEEDLLIKETQKLKEAGNDEILREE